MKLAPSVVARLITQAKRAQERAYAPYSRFPVGAAVLAEDGRVFVGCNVENASYGLTICAERNALAAAVVAAARPVAVAVVGNQHSLLPCGACRQVLAEFNPKLLIVSLNAKGEPELQTLDELFPQAFVLAPEART